MKKIFEIESTNDIEITQEYIQRACDGFYGDKIRYVKVKELPSLESDVCECEEFKDKSGTDYSSPYNKLVGRASDGKVVCSRCVKPRKDNPQSYLDRPIKPKKKLEKMEEQWNGYSDNVFKDKLNEIISHINKEG